MKRESNIFRVIALVVFATTILFTACRNENQPNNLVTEEDIIVSPVVEDSQYVHPIVGVWEIIEFDDSVNAYTRAEFVLRENGTFTMFDGFVGGIEDIISGAYELDGNQLVLMFDDDMENPVLNFRIAHNILTLYSLEDGSSLELTRVD